MADIRINSLPTTATSTSFDDYVAVDGSGNGTRKLSAYSPTFGGNLTVSGTGTSSVAGNLNFNGTGAATPPAGLNYGLFPQSGLGLGINSVAGGVGVWLAANGAFRLNSGTATNDYTGFEFTNATIGITGSSAYVRAIRTASSGSPTDLAFGIMASGTLAEAARFKSNGNFLIGTTSDGGQKLQVSGSASITGALNASTITASSGGNQPLAATSSSTGNTEFSVANSTTGGYLKLIVNGSGAASPVDILFQNTTGLPFLKAATNTINVRFPTTDAATSSISGGFIVGDGSTAATNVAIGGGNIYAGGNLIVSGTGTSSFAGTVNSNVGLRCTATNSNLSLYKDGTPSKAARVILNGSVADGLSLGLYNGTSWTDTLHISTNNNVLIGTTTDGGQKLQVNGTGYFAGALIQLGNGSNDALYRATASNGKSSDFGDDTTGGFVRANNSQSLRFITGGTTALTLDTSQNATFAGNVRAGTVVGTAKTVIIDAAFTTLLNVTKTFTVTMPSPSLASSFVLEVGVYGNTATGYASLMVKGGGYLGSSTLYEATELTKINSGSVTISSVTKASGSMTFTVINTSSSGHVAICYKQTSDDVFTTLPTITAV